MNWAFYCVYLHIMIIIITFFILLNGLGCAEEHHTHTVGALSSWTFIIHEKDLIHRKNVQSWSNPSPR